MSEEEAENNKNQLLKIIGNLLDKLVSEKMVEEMPKSIRSIASLISKLAKKYCPESELTLVGGLVMLRLLNPCITSPLVFGILPKTQKISPVAQKNLILVSKVIQHLSNSLLFQSPPLSIFDSWLAERDKQMKAYFTLLLSPSPLVQKGEREGGGKGKREGGGKGEEERRREEEKEGEISLEQVEEERVENKEEEKVRKLIHKVLFNHNQKMKGETGAERRGEGEVEGELRESLLQLERILEKVGAPSLEKPEMKENATATLNAFFEAKQTEELKNMFVKKVEEFRFAFGENLSDPSSWKTDNPLFLVTPSPLFPLFFPLFFFSLIFSFFFFFLSSVSFLFSLFLNFFS